MPSLRIGMIFGGRSVEHEVSVLTAHQVMAAAATDRYSIVPLYIAKSGQWFTGDVLRHLDNFRDLERLTTIAEPIIFSANTPDPGVVLQRSSDRRGLFGRGHQRKIEQIDVAFPLIHGSHGEDGSLQGLLELADLPYVGSDVTASAIAMNKVLTKRVLRSVELPVLDDISLNRERWEREQHEVVSEVESRFGYPVFVKPARLGSSIGVSRADDAAELRFAADVAATYDNQLLIEPAQQDIVEINCSVLGSVGTARASVCEQPISAGLLSYEDKYMRGGKSQGMKGAQRIVPAPLEPQLISRIQEAAQQAFVAIDAAGVARIDFLVRPETGTFYVNEINTIPGSLAFYLWEATDVPFHQLIDTVISLAQTRHTDKRRNTYAFGSNLLRGGALLGVKTE